MNLALYLFWMPDRYGHLDHGGCNTLYGQATTMGVSLIVNHTIGLTVLTLILLLGRNNLRSGVRG
jgi:transporter family-2 protein